MGWGIFRRPSDGIRLKTKWNNHKYEGGREIKIFQKEGKVLAAGRTRKRIGRVLETELGSNPDGLIGCLYDAGSGV